MSIESMQDALAAIKHWYAEFISALGAGKTIFVVLNESVDDYGAISSTYQNRHRNYTTSPLRHYSSLPLAMSIKNAKGSKVFAKNAIAKGIFDAVGDIMEYSVTLSEKIGTQLFSTKDGNSLGTIVKLDKYPGHLILLPFFDFDHASFEEENEKGDAVWSKEAIRKSKALASQFAQIDEVLRRASKATPLPDWVSDVGFPEAVSRLDRRSAEISAEIAKLQAEQEKLKQEREDSLSLTHLLYENGRALETAVDEALALFGYKTSTFRKGDLEIDHIFVGPSGLRMIGESEGKDNSAIDISKFRQLESNIGEDFERDDVQVPAKGVLFGNGFRLTSPTSRADQFTQKCLINAGRLGTALVRTADLYAPSLYLKDRRDDEQFKAACRSAIESTVGNIVEFPSPPKA